MKELLQETSKFTENLSPMSPKNKPWVVKRQNKRNKKQNNKLFKIPTKFLAMERQNIDIRMEIFTPENG